MRVVFGIQFNIYDAAFTQKKFSKDHVLHDDRSSCLVVLFWRLCRLSWKSCFYLKLLERRHVPVLLFVRLWVRASLLRLLLRRTLLEIEMDGLDQNCFKKNLVVFLWACTAQSFWTFHIFSYVNPKVRWILGRNSWCVNLTTQQHLTCVG